MTSVLREAFYPAVSALLITTVAAQMANAQEKRDAADTRGRRLIDTLLKNNDGNGDGKIAKDEAKGRLKQRFDRVDSDKDGVIDGKELEALAKRLISGGDSRPERTARRPSSVRVPDSVELQADIAYRDGNNKWTLDLARPKERGDDPRPGIVFIHGGGWRNGDKGQGQWRSLPIDYAAKGYVCVSINYRLTDEAPFPACVEDCKCAVRWLRANAGKYNVDPQRIGGYGNSAGAHLVAMLGLAGQDAELEGDGPYRDQSSMLQAVCCSATPADFTNWMKRNGSARGALAGLFAGPEGFADERLRSASPVVHVSAKAPPFLVVHGTADPTVPVAQGDGLVDALKQAGAKDVTYLRYDGANHGVFQQRGKETRPAMEKFFARTLRGKSESAAKAPTDDTTDRR